MNQRPLIAAVLLLAGCVTDPGTDTDPNDTDNCPTWYADIDKDGFGNHLANPVVDCDQPPNHVDNNLDCLDTNPDINPSVPEVCDPNDVDENCNGLIDNDDPDFTGAELEFYPDNDGDGHGDANGEPQLWCDAPEGYTEAPTDCDDADPNTHPGAASREQGLPCMTDADGDGWGDTNPSDGITPGSDCDDTDILINPDAVDDQFDGLDPNCDGMDALLFADDFESGAADPAVWGNVSGNIAHTNQQAAQGTQSMDLFGSNGVMESVAVDATQCPALVWHYQVMVPSVNPADLGDFVHFEYWDGSTWITADSFEGGNANNIWNLREGAITDAAAVHSALQVRFRGDSSITSDHFYVDDFWLGCGADSDGDGHADTFDCAVNDPDHWSDCGSCVDADGDQYGDLCDLGTDCDDADATVNPLGADAYGDGVDSDCSGYDGEGLVEDFEGAWYDVTWIRTPGVDDHIYQDTTYFVSGSNSLNVEADGIVTRQPYNLGNCSSIIWEYQGKRGPSTPEAGDELFFEINTASGWIVADMWDGGATDPNFVVRQGFTGAPDLDGTNLEIRFRGDGIVGDDWYIDDLKIHCAADTDSDGIPDTHDCAVNDPLHWSDCGQCTDLDLDGYGASCDLGEDCDDADATVHPGASDTFGDNVDSNCEGLDGEFIWDEFESGGPNMKVWASVTGNATVETTHVGQGTTSMDLAGGDGVLESMTLDTSACSSVIWHYLGMQGGEGTPDSGDWLELEYFDGANWVPIHSWGGGLNDNVWYTHMGELTDPAAMNASFKVRFRGDSSSTADHYYIDQVLVGCSVPDDGDGLPPALDCNPNDGAHWFDCGLCVDNDGDLYGALCDYGPDCDDANAAVNPAAADASTDGVDQNCDILDGAALMYDDIETGGPDPAVWATWGVRVNPTSTYVGEGTYSLDITYHTDSTIESLAVDTTACPSVAWSFMAMTGGAGAADSGDMLYLEYWDGAAWVRTAQWDGADETQNIWSTRSGILTDLAALQPGLKIRLVGDSSSTADHWYVDAIQLGCTATDNDGDGFPNGMDCNDGDALHWSDCGLCVDGDGDGYGAMCDLGGDCDDANIAVNPLAVDASVDGIDQDCDFFDGGPVVFDDFETGGPDPLMWASWGGNVLAETTYVKDGAYAINIQDDVNSTIESHAFDLSACPAVSWSFDLMTGGAGQADSGDMLFFEYWDGASWVRAGEWNGGSENVNEWSTRGGVLVDPAAAHANFKIRLVGDSSVSSDHWYVDNVAVGCTGADNDGDGFPNGMDCNDSDANHWQDCGLCVDADNDDFGMGCDLGPDCDDGNSAINGDADDLTFDGIDQDCNSMDGPTLVADDFELNAAPDPAVWASVTGNISAQSVYAYSGSTAMDLFGSNGIMESVATDSTICNAIVFRYRVMVGGAGVADAGDFLYAEYWDGSSWVIMDSFEGGNGDNVWYPRLGLVTDPGAFHAGFKVRFRGDSSITSDHFYVDDVVVGCAGADNDGDGFPAGMDCDDTDFWHWTDCGVCVDADVDGFGAGCDLGEDCDDNSDLVAPPIPDLLLDGVDENCDGLDLLGWVDDFENGAVNFAVLGADATLEPSAQACGFFSFGACGMHLRLDGYTNSTAETVTWDSTACNSVGWAFEGARGPVTPEAGNNMYLEWDTGLGWTRAYDWLGGSADAQFSMHSGVITDPAALAPNLRFRFVADPSNLIGDEYSIDNFRIGCAD